MGRYYASMSHLVMCTCKEWPLGCDAQNCSSGSRGPAVNAIWKERALTNVTHAKICWSEAGSQRAHLAECESKPPAAPVCAPGALGGGRGLSHSVVLPILAARSGRIRPRL